MTDGAWTRLASRSMTVFGKLPREADPESAAQSSDAERHLARRLEMQTAGLVAAQAVARTGSWDTDLVTMKVSWSAETHRIFETDPAVFSPTHDDFLNRAHPDDRSAVNAAFVNSLGKNGVHSIEHRILMPDGRIKFVEERWQAFLDEHQQPTRAIGTCQDITDRKLTELQLERQQTEMRVLFDLMPAMIWFKDTANRILRVNERVAALAGRPVEEIEGRPSEEIYPDDAARFFADDLDVINSGMPKLGIVEPVHAPDGSRMWVQTDKVPYRDKDGKVIGIVVMAQDISHRLRIEGELRASVGEISRINRALDMLSNCNEVLVRAESEKELLDQICRIAVENGGYRMAWVGYAQNDEPKTIKPMAHAGNEHGYLSEVTILWDEASESGCGPGGRIIRTGSPVVCEDVSADESFIWRSAAERRGYRGFVGLPLRNALRTFGVLGLYSAEKNVSSDAELVLLRKLADNIAFGIGNLRSQIERRRLQLAVTAVAAGVSASTGVEFFEQLARNMAEALGADAAFVAKLVDGDPTTARTVAAVVGGELIDNFEYVIAGTPCEEQRATKTCVVTSGVSVRYPKATRLEQWGAQGFVGRRLDSSSGGHLGFLFVVFREELHDVEFVTSTLQIFAARAASELERRDTDVTLREQAALLDIAHEAIVVRSLDGRITYWNKGAERTYGWTPSDVIGRKAVEFLFKDPASFEEARAAAVATGEWQGELIKRTKDGREINVDSRWTLVSDRSGKPKSMLSMDTDITEKKQLEAQLRRAQRMESIGTLAGGIAHDLNNVLAPILMSVDGLTAVAREQEDRALLFTLKGSAQRGADLVKQLLTFARGANGERFRVSLTQVASELLTVLRDTFPKSVKLSFPPPGDSWGVLGDPTQMHQVLLNLCVNARDAMPDGGVLTLSIENIVLTEASPMRTRECRPGEYVLVKVRDSGAGISRNDRERIFDPFFTTKEVGKGTGLGLSTSLAIVKAHGGFIEVDSELGSGSTFSVYLPADSAHLAPRELPVAPPPGVRGDGELILVIDDEEAIRKVLKRLLEKAGYQVLLASDGGEGVQIYVEHQSEIAAVLTDMAMPVMDGAATIIALRAINPDVVVIASSGRSSSESVPLAVGQAVHHFIAKPYTSQAILKTLNEALGKFSN